MCGCPKTWIVGALVTASTHVERVGRAGRREGRSRIVEDDVARRADPELGSTLGKRLRRREHVREAERMIERRNLVVIPSQRPRQAWSGRVLGVGVARRGRHVPRSIAEASAPTTAAWTYRTIGGEREARSAASCVGFKSMAISMRRRRASARTEPTRADGLAAKFARQRFPGL